MNLTEAGQYFTDHTTVNWWRKSLARHILLDPSWLQTSKPLPDSAATKRLLELLKPSDLVGHLLRPRDVLAHRPSAKSGAAKLVCPTCDYDAHQQLVDPLDTLHTNNQVNPGTRASKRFVAFWSFL